LQRGASQDSIVSPRLLLLFRSRRWFWLFRRLAVDYSLVSSTLGLLKLSVDRRAEKP
jgi:hypothetical protein